MQVVNSGAPVVERTRDARCTLYVGMSPSPRSESSAPALGKKNWQPIDARNFGFGCGVIVRPSVRNTTGKPMQMARHREKQKDRARGYSEYQQ